MTKPINTLIFLFLPVILLGQINIDSSKSEKKKNIDNRNNSTPQVIQHQFLNPIPKNTFEKTELPLNLQIFSKAFANDYKPSPVFSNEELASGLSDDELSSFNNNKLKMQKELYDFYGEDLIDIEKLLESIGLNKDQVIALAAALKFIFAQGLLRAPVKN